MKNLALAMLSVIFLLANAVLAYADSINIDAPAYILIDARTGLVLAEKNADEKMYPASTTKIMTAILALEKGDLNSLMTASARAIDPGPGGMHIGINEGEQIVLEDLINALMIQSANDTANIIAENIGPTYDEFIDSMNSRAAELGAVNTHFVNPHGMHDENHYTTVRDMAKIAQYAMTIGKFRDIVKKISYNMRPTNKHDKWDTLYTINKLLKNLPQYKSDYFTAIGVKSGYTSQAGNNLVSAAMNTEGMELIAVVFGVRGSVNHDDVYACTKKLLEYGFKNFKLQTLINAGEVVEGIKVKDADENTVLNLITQDQVSAVLPKELEISTVEKNIMLSGSGVAAPVRKDEVLGSIEFRKDGILLGKTNILAEQSVEKSTKAAVRESIKKASGNPFVKRAFTGIMASVLAFLALRMVLRRVSRAINSKS